VSEAFLVLRRIYRDVLINICRSSCKLHAILVRVQILEKHSNTTFKENPSNGSRVVGCGQTDGRMDLILAFHNFANTLTILRSAHTAVFVCFVWI